MPDLFVPMAVAALIVYAVMEIILFLTAAAIAQTVLKVGNVTNIKINGSLVGILGGAAAVTAFCFILSIIWP